MRRLEKKDIGNIGPLGMGMVNKSVFGWHSKECIDNTAKEIERVIIGDGAVGVNTYLNEQELMGYLVGGRREDFETALASALNSKPCECMRGNLIH